MDIPTTMHAVLLKGHGGYDMLEYRTDVAVPTPGPGEVLVHVGASGVNNTDINTRIGWYSKSVRSATGGGAREGFDDLVADDGGWAGEALTFPRIQGADVAGKIVAVGPGVDPARVGDRVLVRAMQDPLDGDPTGCITMGSEIDGGFAQFCAVRSSEAFPIRSSLSDVELASFPCAYSTAEGMLHRADVSAGERVLVTGASGGVGSALVQLAKRRGAHVIAMASASKWDAVAALGADELVDRGADLVEALGSERVDAVADVVAGEAWPAFLEVLRRQGRYVTSGAIAGPIVELDVRTLYLKDLSLLGSTRQPRVVFEQLIDAIESGEVRPVVAATYPLDQIVAAQEQFQSKGFAGKLVLIPPPLD